MEQRLLWAELRVSLVKFYGLLRPSTTSPANSHPWSKAGIEINIKEKNCFFWSNKGFMAGIGV
jgi:hypothetical protein